MPEISTTPTSNIDAVRKFYDVFTTGNTGDFDDILAENWQPLPAVPGNPGGRDGQKGTVGYLRAVLGNLAYTVEEIYACGDNVVACRCLLSGVHRGPFLGLGATHQRIEMMTMEFHRFSDGKIVATRHLEDFFGVWQKLQASGAKPAQ